MFSASTYAARRAQLVRSLSGNANGLILLPGNTLSPVNYADNAYPFRQDSTFLYYFGLSQSDITGIIDIDSGEATLWTEEQTMDGIIWCGPELSRAEKAATCGCDNHGSPAQLQTTLADARTKGRTIHILPPYRAETREWLTAMQLGDVAPSQELIDAVIKQRLVKSDEEVAEIEKALGVSHDMYMRAMQAAVPGVTEQQVAGVLHGALAEAGCLPSFHPICSVRSEVLHNHTHGNTLKQGDLLLIDSGAETACGYASDITRALPIGGKFSTRQREIYDIVLAAQEAAIAKSTAGTANLDCHITAATTIANGLLNLGILRGSVDDIVANGAHTLFFPHGIGHHIGLDAHDMENLGEDNVGYGDGYTRSTKFGFRSLRLARPLCEGNTITVEPGIYFIPALMDRWKAEGTCADFINFDVADSYRDFGGIRIEDDLLITAQGPRILGPGIPKTAGDIEILMAR